MWTRVCVVFLLTLGIALADEAAELRPQGVAKVQFKGKTLDVDKPLTLALTGGDQICVLQGQVKLARAQGELSLNQGQCFQTEAPRNLGQSLVTFVRGLFAQPRTASTTALQSRGGDCEKAPAVHIPQNFDLPELLIPASGRPNPKALNLLDAAGKVVYTLESQDDRAVFRVPTAELAKASRLQILNSRGQAIYVGDIFRVEFAQALPKDPHQAAEALLSTGLTDYAHAAYSYLSKSGTPEEIKALEDEIRVGFACAS